jgi:hypothetical protein
MVQAEILSFAGITQFFIVNREAALLQLALGCCKVAVRNFHLCLYRCCLG